MPFHNGCSVMAGDDKVGSLEQEALKRKERLRALRENRRTEQSEALRENKRTEQSEANAEVNRESLPRPVFRSYKPEDETLQEAVLPVAAPESVEEQIKDRVSPPEDFIKEVDLSSLAPRKPDWDLKRDVAKKLEKLDKRTKRAIAELIRERLCQNSSDLAVAVNTASGPQDVDSDEE